MSARFLDVWLLILLSALWGASYLFMRIAGPALGPVVLMAFRVSIAVVILFAYLGILRQWPDFRRYWKPFLLMGILNNVIPFVLIANAVIHLNASIAAILNATTPLFTAVVAAWWIKEPLGARKAIGVVLGMAGVAVLVGWSPLPLTPGVIVAALQALLAALSYGLAAVHARRQFMGVPPLHAAVGQLSGSTAILLPLGVLLVAANTSGCARRALGRRPRGGVHRAGVRDVLPADRYHRRHRRRHRHVPDSLLQRAVGRHVPR